MWLWACLAEIISCRHTQPCSVILEGSLDPYLSPSLILICQRRLRWRWREGEKKEEEEGWKVIAPLLLHYGVIPLLTEDKIFSKSPEANSPLYLQRQRKRQKGHLAQSHNQWWRQTDSVTLAVLSAWYKKKKIYISIYVRCKLLTRYSQSDGWMQGWALSLPHAAWHDGWLMWPWLAGAISGSVHRGTEDTFNLLTQHTVQLNWCHLTRTQKETVTINNSQSQEVMNIRKEYGQLIWLWIHFFWHTCHLDIGNICI